MSDQDSDGLPSADREVDARGLNCPLPILRAKKALNELQSGQLLKVLATDPGSKRDFEAFARQTGHRLIRTDERAREWTFLLQKLGRAEAAAVWAGRAQYPIRPATQTPAPSWGS